MRELLDQVKPKPLRERLLGALAKGEAAADGIGRMEGVRTTAAFRRLSCACSGWQQRGLISVNWFRGRSERP